MIRTALAALALIGALASAQAADEKVVKIYDWADYIAPDVLDEFTRETGIRVVYDTYDSNATLEQKLLTGHSGYDVVGPSAPFLEQEIRSGALQRLDRKQLPNWKYLWPQIMQKLAEFDPGNAYAVNYMWFTTGIAYNVDAAARRLNGLPVNSWDVVFKPEYIRRFADCGVYMPDDPAILFSSALRFLDLDPNSKNPLDIRRAAGVIARVRPYVKGFSSSSATGALANGDVCLAVASTGDGLQARDRATESSNGTNVEYAVPQEGAALSLDNLAIPAGAPDPQEAHAFINFLMRPDIAARDSATTGLANGVIASRPLIDKQIAADRAIFPDDATINRLFVVTPSAPVFERFVTREWALVKRGL